MTVNYQDYSINSTNSVKEFIENPNIEVFGVDDIQFSREKNEEDEIYIYSVVNVSDGEVVRFIGLIKTNLATYILCWTCDLEVLYFDDLETAITYVILHNHSKRLGNVFCQY